MNNQTTEKDFQWFYADEDVLAPPHPPVAQEAPATTPDVEQEDEEATPASVRQSADYSEVKDGDFTEEIEGEIVENPPKPRGIPITWLLPIGLGALLIALTVMVVVLPIFTASATIIITPDKQTLRMEATLSAQARRVLNKSLTLSAIAQTTGTAHQNASVARGLITFYNALPSPQVVSQGTLITGADGYSVVTEEDAYIPAGALAVNGQVTVPARTTTTGESANIQAGDISGACCRDYVFARNSQFTGGADARDYQTPTKTDIQTASQQMSETLQESMTAQAQKQLSSGEAVLPPECTSKTTSSQTPGMEAAQITVSLTSKCTAYAYSRADIQKKEATVFNDAIISQLGSGYQLEGGLTEQITGTLSDRTDFQITVSLSGKCVYHFTREEISNIQRLITGKSQAQAILLLLHTRGVKTAGVQIDNGKTTVPDNVRNIAVSIYERG